MKKIILSLLLSLPVMAVSGADTPLMITQGHVALCAVIWDPEQEEPLSLMVEAETSDGEVSSLPEDCIVVCPESMKMNLPDGTPLGNSGDWLWILPQSHYEGVPYLGVRAKEVPLDIFQDSINIQLTGVEGPGDFLLWQSTSGIDMRMDSRDGLSPGDSLEMPAGGHAHYNWGFTAPGVYQLSFRAQATKVGESEPIYSPDAVYTFHVLPLPELSPFETWQAIYWNAGNAEAVPEADPDRDGLPNLVEYAAGTHPLEKDSAHPLSIGFIHKEGKRYCQLSFNQSAAATDCSCEVIARDSLGVNSTEEILKPLSGDTGEKGIKQTFEDPSPLSSKGKFYQLKVSLLR
ncbi:MAG: hypothetical protein EOM03_06705 [Clostridia bacterium]|nr:hypothetical protein [Clostridia bacterium]